ncbi:MAG: NAD-dependent epimerase/dehydratase family protein, partial [Cyanobacteria bacterium NC_groundwater_1444_Ag_S-0.65um_54_12]|nr:NAD-dependent epimerase/dehydratase family protein [Cyanobacteria bacterium NC_groundwater_1444_Ag_S-0.65um_54_12]
METCIVTGAAGLVGAQLLRAPGSDWEVIGISRRELGSDLDSARIRHLPIDLARHWDISCLPRRADVVIHLAQSEHFREFPSYAEEIFQVNTFSTLRLLDYARRAGVRTFVLASSGGIYGHGNQEFTEEGEVSAPGDLSYYLGTKLGSEVLAESYTPYLTVIVLRFFFVYGPGQRKEMLIPRLIQSVREGSPITLQGENGIRINP